MIGLLLALAQDPAAPTPRESGLSVRFYFVGAHKQRRVAHHGVLEQRLVSVASVVIISPSFPYIINYSKEDNGMQLTESRRLMSALEGRRGRTHLDSEQKYPAQTPHLT